MKGENQETMKINIYSYTYAARKFPKKFSSQTETPAPDLLNC